MIVAPVNRIIPFSMVDGPGSRTAVFLQGCNISCVYCHNPETQQLCNNCGICVAGCPTQAIQLEDGIVIWDEQKCIRCDQCIIACPRNSSPRVIKSSVEEVFKSIELNIPLIRGITVSGGECMLYPEFILALFNKAKDAKLTTLIDTNGTVDFSEYPQLLKVCDGVMLDVKSWDSANSFKLTGSGNEVVKKNLKLLAQNNLLEEIRIVCLDDLIDVQNIIQGIATILGDLTARQKLRLIRFSPLGVRTALKDMQPPSTKNMKEFLQFAKRYSFKEIRIT